jgi:hypothetical protein
MGASQAIAPNDARTGSEQFESPADLLRWARERAESQQRSGRLSLARLAERGGFKSRAYVREVIEGRRKLTFEALDAFAHMLELSGPERAQLRALVELERGLPGAAKKLEALRRKQRRVRQRRRVSVDQTSAAIGTGAVAAPMPPVSPRTLHVYAAVPDPRASRTLVEIARVAGLPAAVCEQELALMQARGWIACEDGRYRTLDGHLIIDELRSVDFLRGWYTDELGLAAQDARERFQDATKLFVTSKLSVREADLQSLVLDLRETMSAWIERNMAAEGEKVVSFSLALR